MRALKNITFLVHLLSKTSLKGDTVKQRFNSNVSEK